MRVLVCVAHPDDEVLGVGGTIAKHVVAGDEVHVLIAADCVSARDGSNPVLPDAARVATDVLRVCSLSFLGLPGMTLAAGLSLNRAIETHVKVVSPEVVYTHHRMDLNSDHRAVAEATVVACRPMGTFPRRLLHFETPSSTEWDPASAFCPNVFVDVSKVLDVKLRAMACYAKELREPPHPRNLDALRQRAAYWGQVAGCLYAEPFVLAREII